ncbi:sugar ABC transporter ATP-binding protein [Salinisphaera hydrothermalis]|uniref:sugar ABC transporter ATP-binding protein n=1 Tax=Salinisphaera hydrothermalis TaxID=563188 RepID=UPI00333EE6FA
MSDELHIAFSLRSIGKSFGGVAALDGVDLDIRRGEVHALIGENGAGKSTLMKVLSGGLKPDDGWIEVGANQVSFNGPEDSRRQGITIIHQELELADDLTVAENIFIGELPGWINWRDMHTRARALIQRLGFDIDPSARVGDLSVAHQQVVEIAKALSRDVSLLVLDEPTAVLGPSDAERLLEIVKELSQQGVSIIYISHRLDEIFRCADRITVLKDGRKVSTVDPKEVDVDGLVRLMVGRRLTAMFPERENTIGEPLLDVAHLSRAGVIEDVSLSVRAGEIVGLGGLVGSGRTELVRMIFGADRATSGEIRIKGRPARIRHPHDAVAHGIGLVPEDRKAQGAVLDMALHANVTMAHMRSVTRLFGWIRETFEREISDALIGELAIKTQDCRAEVANLSGGNQQKVVLAKWFHTDSEIVILDEPTRGVDVGGKSEIYTLIQRMAQSGKAILVISSESEELMGLCDRILVMGGGRLRGELVPDQFSSENILTLSLRRDSSLREPEDVQQ